jgi:hypothetical protein
VTRLLVLLLALAAAASAAARQGSITMAEVSGAAALPGGSLLLVSDERLDVALVPDAAARLQSGSVKLGPGESLEPLLKGKVELDDLEDAAFDGQSDVFLITSHSRTRLDETPESRYRLARLHFDATGKLIEARQSDALLKVIQTEVPFLADSIRRPPAKAGFNIEGLASTPEGHLLVGLRAPTITESTKRADGGQEDAVLFAIRNPHALFQSPPAAASLGEVVKIDLDGQGVRGMCYDPDRRAFWLLAGLSVDPNHPVRSPWALWLWDRKSEPVRARLPEGINLEQPESVCRIDVSGKPHLLLIGDGAPESRYALVPADEVRVVK